MQARAGASQVGYSQCLLAAHVALLEHARPHPCSIHCQLPASFSASYLRYPPPRTCFIAEVRRGLRLLPAPFYSCMLHTAHCTLHLSCRTVCAWLSFKRLDYILSSPCRPKETPAHPMAQQQHDQQAAEPSIGGMSMQGAAFSSAVQVPRLPSAVMASHAAVQLAAAATPRHTVSGPGMLVSHACTCACW